MTTVPAAPAAGKRVNRVLPPKPLQAAIVIAGFTALLYLVEFVNLAFLHGTLVGYGIRSREVSGLLGVLFAPLLHQGWPHLIANTVPVLLFGFLAMAVGTRVWVAVTAVIWLVSGLGVWLTGPEGAVTVGASGIAFGWLVFLLVRGLFNRSIKQLLAAAVLFFYWGGVLWGLLPGADPGISWQAHLFGAFGGLLTAWLVSRADRATTRRQLTA
ncbi:membrane associated rhomboid family serine protease [Kutzneria viridogrisea]|uniref:Membrane associated rhomboid family serine protease n=1 Tax=Kutzneria viridogrisea TaxID=47990 RepID=A0ABR6BUS1_9PSEU|nr:rhomboid family intramembrane serine protease [Kutzneria albida]MBA8930294.1 membrane associated rhomboid family serine protease [Kutzneria viridogrisea]